MTWKSGAAAAGSLVVVDSKVQSWFSRSIRWQGYLSLLSKALCAKPAELSLLPTLERYCTDKELMSNSATINNTH